MKKARATQSSIVSTFSVLVSSWMLILGLVLGSAANAQAPVPPTLTKTFVPGATAMAAGSLHTCVVVGGAVKCWGYNAHGELGNGSNIHSATLVNVVGVSGAIALAAGSSHTCALLAGGSVKCWGDNHGGQLGNGSTSVSTTAVDVIGVNGASALVADQSHTCAVIAGGTVKCWGYNSNGQLGNGSRLNSPTPADVIGVTGATALAAGSLHTCAVVAGGAVKCWGYNAEGQLGNGSTIDSTTAVEVTAVRGATALAAGYYHTCALVADGAVKCWGHNLHGQLGTGYSIIRSTTALDVIGVTGATALVAGLEHACVLVAGGQIKCWGFTGYGQAGADYFGTVIYEPRELDGIGDAFALAAGNRHTCALIAGGTLDCWGDNYFGQLGNGKFISNPTPVNVTGVSGATALAAGGGHSCTLVAGGAVKCWGDNGSGQLGNGSRRDSPTPVNVTGVSGATVLAAGGGHTCVLVAGGAVRCWGDNASGQLGNGSTTISTTAVEVTGVIGATALTAGIRHTCALVAGGVLKCWGDNTYGQLGNGSLTNSVTAVDVSDVSGTTAIAAGGFHTCAVVAGRAVKCWGYNGFGQIGIGNPPQSTTAVYVAGVSGAAGLAAGGFHSCAVVAGGALKCWGYNEHGELGDGSRNNSPTPVDVIGVTDTIALSAGSRHTCAVIAGGALKCWGYNADGQLGNFSTADLSTPAIVTGVTGTSTVAAGGGHTCALVAGTARCWGGSVHGQLGDGTSGYVTGAAVLQSNSSTGAPANAASAHGVVSGTGRKIAFASDADNLDTEHDNHRDIFLRDPVTRVTTHISAVVAAIDGGTQEDFDDPAISADGTRIAFSGSVQVYAAVSGLGRVLSSNANGALGNAPSRHVILPGAGNLAFFESQASNLLSSADNNGFNDIFVKDLTTGAVTLISRGANGEPANGPSSSPWATDDGQFVAFSSLATNLVPGGNGAGAIPQVLLVRNDGLNTDGLYLSRNPLTGQFGNGPSTHVRLTPDGRYGVFESLANNLVAGDTNNASDVFRFELSGNTVISLIPVSTSILGFGNGGSRHPSISSDGQSITFETDATNLIESDGNDRTDVLVKSMVTGELLRLAPTIDAQEPNGASTDPEISQDGRTITFTSSASNLIFADTNSVADIFSVALIPPGQAFLNSPLDEPGFTALALPVPDPAFPNCPGGYFVAVVDDGPGDGLSPGIFGMDLTLNAPGSLHLEGGLNFGGSLDGSQVAFAGFNIQNDANEPQQLNLTITGNPGTSQSAALPVRLKVIRQPSAGVNELVFETVATLSLAQAYVHALVVNPGFHVVTVGPEGAASVPGGAADGQVYVSLASQFVGRPGGGFFGGVVVGGYHSAPPFGDNSGFASFCLGTAHSASARLYSTPSFGPTGARDLRLRLLDYLGRLVVALPQ